MTVRSLISVHRPRYFRFCNVLHIWTIRAIPTYRVYRLYDKTNLCIYKIPETEMHMLRQMNGEVGPVYRGNQCLVLILR